ncbi:MAG TPA: hypothetical protein VFS45_00475, partial [Sphingomicrobium sp.]|nr:hypothetical protein [Sphingomicrobium sp.]
GAGDDVYVIDRAGDGVNPGDGVIEAPGGGTDEIRTYINWGLGGIPDVENLTALGTANIFLGGNDRDNVLTGNGGNNYFVGEGGNDTIDGGGNVADGANSGRDIASYQLAPGAVGSLVLVDGTGADAGKLLVQLVDGASVQTVLRITLTGQGGAIIEGVGPGAYMGTDTVANIEELHVFIRTSDGSPTPSNQFVSVSLTPNQYGNSVGGSEGSDTIALADYPGALNSNGGRGDDSITATADNNYLGGGAGNDLIQAGDGDDSLDGGDGNDTLRGGAGNDSFTGGLGDDVLEGGDANDYLAGEGGDDVIDGGAGGDVAAFQLPVGTPGTFSLVDGTGDDAGKLLVQLTSGGVTETFLKVTVTGQGSATIEGVGIGAFLGIDSVTNVEQLHIAVPEAGGQFIAINLAPSHFGTFVGGSEGSDTIDLATYPGAINSNGGRGDDTIIGTADVNNLNGGLGNDTLDGLGGNDRLVGGAGGDTLNGGDGNDTLIGAFNTGFGPQPGDGADILRGGGGGDLIRGGDGDDLLEGGEGNDNLRGDAGSDTLDGGAGEDFVSYFFTALGSGITFDARHVGATSTSTIADPLGGTDTLIDIESIGIGGTNFDDILYGSEHLAPTAHYANQMSGNGGNDQMYGASGVDFIDGGTGNDALYGSGGDDIVYGGVGNDLLDAGSGDDLMVGGAGDDVLDGGTGMADVAVFHLPLGTVGTYTIEDGTGAYAGQKVVVLTDGASSSIVAAISQTGDVLTVTGVGAGSSLGTDTISNVDRLMFGTTPADGSAIPAGAAVLEVASGVVADGLIAGAEVFMDSNGDGVWNPGEARTTTAQDGTFAFLATGSGPVIVVGGTNTDTGLPNLVVMTAPAGSTVINPLTTLIQSVLESAPAGTTAEQAAEMVAASLGISSSVDLLNTDVFSAAAGGDPEALEAQKAAAVVVSILVAAADAGGSAAGAEVLANLAVMVVATETGEQIDLTDQSTIEEALSGALDPAEIAQVAPGLSDSAQQIDNATDLGGISEAQAEALTRGNDLDNVISGGLLDDELFGFGGNDSISANDGNDRLDGGAGDDQLNGGSGTDTAAYDAAAAGVTVNLGTGTASGGGGNDTLVGIENVIGSSFADQLTGDSANNRLDGAAGADSLAGGGGDDRLTGGAGADRIDGGTGTDTADYGGSTAAVSINLASAKFSGGDATGDTLISIENVIGSDFDDILVGSQGSNLLDGGAGRDTLNGGGGADQLWGGAGSDLFLFKSSSDITSTAGSDVIMDFDAGSTLGSTIDRIDLSAIDANSKTKKEDAFTFIGDSAFTGQAGQLRVETDGNGKSTVMGDVNGDGVADFTLVVCHTGIIGAEDFWL